MRPSSVTVTPSLRSGQILTRRVISAHLPVREEDAHPSGGLLCRRGRRIAVHLSFPRAEHLGRATRVRQRACCVRER